jgi:hypothetical protein
LVFEFFFASAPNYFIISFSKGRVGFSPPILSKQTLLWRNERCKMAEKLPTIIDNRGDNTLLHALQRLLPGVQGLDITTGLFEIGSFLLLEQLWQG